MHSIVDESEKDEEPFEEKDGFIVLDDDDNIIEIEQIVFFLFLCIFVI